MNLPNTKDKIYISIRDAIKTGPRAAYGLVAMPLTWPTFTRKIKNDDTFMQRGLNKLPEDPWNGFTVAKAASGLVGIITGLTINAGILSFVAYNSSQGDHDPLIYTTATYTTTNAISGTREIIKNLKNKRLSLIVS